MMLLVRSYDNDRRTLPYLGGSIFWMPFNYLRYFKVYYKSMSEWRLDCILFQEYGLIVRLILIINNFFPQEPSCGLNTDNVGIFMVWVRDFGSSFWRSWYFDQVYGVIFHFEIDNILCNVIGLFFLVFVDVAEYYAMFWGNDY